MEEEKEKLPELKVTEDDLIDICISGDTYDKKRHEACFDLGEICINRMHKLEPSQRESLRREIISDTSFVNHEDISETIEISGKKFPMVYTEPHIFGADFDTEKFIKGKKDDKKFGICSLALYGLELQFIEQMDKGMFQTKENAKSLGYLEELILSDNDKKDRKYIICNKILNPKVPEGKYKVCSEADLENHQHFFIMKRELQEKGFKADKYEDLTGVSMKDIWAFTKPEWKDILLNKAKINVLIGAEDKDWGEFTDSEQDSLFYAYHSYPDDKIPEMIYSKQDWYRWVETARLNCWHNFLKKQPLPEKLTSAWLEIQLSMEAGEISEEEAIKLIDQLAKEENLVKLSTTYQPTRLRLFGSQFALNSLLNQVLLTEPLTMEVVYNNSEAYKTIRGGFDTEDLIQLTVNKILTTEERERIKKISYITADNLWEILRDEAYENARTYTNENLWKYIGESDIRADYRKLAELMDEDSMEIFDHVEYYIPQKWDGINPEPKKGFYEVAYGSVTDIEDEWDEFGEYELSERMDVINKKYKDLTPEEAWYIIESGDQGWYFSFDVDWTAQISYDWIEERVEEYIDECIKPEIAELESEMEMRKGELDYIMQDINFIQITNPYLASYELTHPTAQNYAELTKEARDLDGRMLSIQTEIGDYEDKISEIMNLLDKIAKEAQVENTLKEED